MSKEKLSVGEGSGAAKLRSDEKDEMALLSEKGVVPTPLEGVC